MSCCGVLRPISGITVNMKSTKEVTNVYLLWGTALHLPTHTVHSSLYALCIYIAGTTHIS